MKDFQAQPNSLANRTILVTGAGAGIGKGAAIAYARQGARVILLGRTLEKLEKVYDEILALKAPEPVILPLDLEKASVEDYKMVAESIMEQFGHLDGLLNNAALLGPKAPISFYNEQTWLQVMQVNINSAFMLTKALLPALQAAPNASVVFTSSSVGKQGRAYWGAYSVSKFAVEGFSQVLADELRQTSKVRVNCIDPGATRTAMRKDAYPAENPDTLPTPADIMPTYLYLMDDASIGTTGQSLRAQAPK
ncbi:MAG: YciK family oxidoreductase [Pseudohongiellaceae bacterium]|nr:YciK family oxidoreductase [Pseudohongiellaceae bacterium]